MRLLDTTAVVRADGTVKFVGMDMSNGNKPMLYVDHKDGVLVVRHPGGKCWDGVGRPARHVRSHFIVFRYEKEKRASTETAYSGRVLFSIPLRSEVQRELGRQP